MKRTWRRLRHVLVLEPSPVYAEFLRGLLEVHGLTAVSMSTPAEALLRLADESFDLLVSELLMPGRDGPAVMRACRSGGLHLPVIFLADEPTDVHVKKAALDDCCATLLTRPVDLDVFERALVAADARSHHEDCVHWRGRPNPPPTLPDR